MLIHACILLYLEQLPKKKNYKVIYSKTLHKSGWNFENVRVTYEKARKETQKKSCRKQTKNPLSLINQRAHSRLDTDSISRFAVFVFHFQTRVIIIFKKTCCCTKPVTKRQIVCDFTYTSYLG